jgi:hypothetical protein
MSITPGELIILAPKVEQLVKLLTDSLRRDGDGKVRITKVEAKKICKLAAEIALHFAKDALD